MKLHDKRTGYWWEGTQNTSNNEGLRQSARAEGWKHLKVWDQCSMAIDGSLKGAPGQYAAIGN